MPNQGGHAGFTSPQFSAWQHGGKQTIALQEQQLAEQQRQWNERLGLYRDWLGQQKEGTGGISNLYSAYQNQFAEAQAANEAKYKAQLGLVDQTSGQQAADIRSSYGKQRSSALQNLARTGLSNTTVGSTVTQGLQREESSSLNRLADQLLGTKLGVMQGFNYQTPDTGPLQSLIAALAPQKQFAL